MDAAAFWKVIGEYNLNTGVYQKKNLLLLILLTLWGLTGVKALIFSAYEDVILLLAGIYGVWLIISDRILKKKL